MIARVMAALRASHKIANYSGSHQKRPTLGWVRLCYAWDKVLPPRFRLGLVRENLYNSGEPNDVDYFAKMLFRVHDSKLEAALFDP